MARTNRTVSFALTPALVADLEQLAVVLQRHPTYRAANLSRSAIVRLLLERGLDALKKEIGESPRA